MIKLPFFNRKRRIELQPSTLNLENIPGHVAIIMDGNGRWAKKRGLPRIAGHKEGMTTVRRIVKAANRIDVKVLTLYAFSKENWKRPQAEVDFLMKLPKEFLTTYLPELIEENVKVQTIGDFEGLPSFTKEAIKEAMEQTKHNDGLILNFALNYGGRYELVHAVQSMMQDISDKKLQMEDIDESCISSYLYTEKLSDPDLIIRTSGEHRLSNFLLWQSAYSELWFTEVLWPDFDELLFEQAVSDFQNRKRRYGGI
ncbi:isoprenyl transferase [Terribacillus saccharophilus]|uniref:Isoprenyl transferase n=1 Tax=Terribacillus saccharophilus TaxID=361277 RepID=A0ABX4H382_9BACI|nr:isoprenyl transferase [Terribacillus saccharophilus]PAD37034.1 isoprenyl transferase [Terribacillus saccharophilus]PAD97510.1 isoprenyl transferase [Terribacillus saccharophilus]PAE01559.1 isoprenyl transferase [Terribacillus saccharophilus]